jgi:hypothetical protein
VGAGGTKETKETTTGTGGGKATVGAAGKAATAGSKAAAAGKGGNGGTMATAGTGGKAGDTEPPDVACNPADKTADPTPVTSWSDTDTPPTGPYKVVIESDPGIPTQTIYRPEVNGKIKMPVIVWGEGGCIGNGLIMVQFLYDVASHGFLIIADGAADGAAASSSGGTGEGMKSAMDWITAENERPCSQYYHKVDTTKFSASGQSCGGLMTYSAAADPRLTTIVIWNSGSFSLDTALLSTFHAPMAYFLGGESDIAYANGERDYAWLAENAKFPVFDGNNTFGHGGTYNADNGGECARVGEAWWRWQLMGDEGPTGKQMFWGKDCGLCKDPGWTVKSVNMGM